MATILEKLPLRARVLVIRLRSLGDCVLTTPALALLKECRPDLRVGVVVEPRFAAIFEEIPVVEDILVPSWTAAARWGAKLCLNLHGGTRSMALTAASSAPLRSGFVHFRGGALYNVRIPRAQEILGEERTVHTAEHLASAVFYLGVPRRPIPRALLAAKLERRAQPYAVIHPMASEPGKTWPAGRFFEVARHLEVECGIEPVFLGGPGESVEPFRRHALSVGQPLAKVKALIAGAALFAGNDSGPAHIAAAFGVPSLVLFGPSNPEIWGPWQTEAVVLHSPQGLDQVSSGQVIEALNRLLERRSATPAATGRDRGGE